jgi:hypothetical protein
MTQWWRGEGRREGEREEEREAALATVADRDDGGGRRGFERGGRGPSSHSRSRATRGRRSLVDCKYLL